jgi:5,10-methylenetetrahydromethanopterin reductase
VWVGDSPALYPDPWAALALIATHTERIGLGVAVLVPSTRHVMTNAAAIAGLEALASGRLAVAVGTGFTARRAFGKHALGWATTGQYIADLKALLRGETITVDGALTRMMHPAGLSAPTPVKTPVLVAANGPKGLEVARELGDGVISVQAPIPGFAWSAILQGGTVLLDGEELDSPRVFEALGPVVASFYHGAYDAMGEGVDGFPNGAAWRAMIERFPEEERHLYLHQEHCYSISEHDRAHIDVAGMAPMTFTGTAEALQARARDMQAAGMTELLYLPCGPDLLGEMERMAGVFI